MIFDSPPTSWQQLQTRVCQAFREMGYAADVSRVVDLVRGKKEIDVFVQESIDGVITLYFIECKFWDTAVPQEVVHGFRTVVADGGAHKGLIISKKGFQSGAHEVATKSNVDVLSWEEFNARYFARWKQAVQKRLAEKAKRIIEFRNFPYGPMVDEEIHKLTEQQHNAWLEVAAKGVDFAILGTRPVVDELDEGPVKLIHPDYDIHSQPIDEKMFWTVKTPREWYDFLDPKLTDWNAKIDTWYDAYRAGGGKIG